MVHESEGDGFWDHVNHLALDNVEVRMDKELCACESRKLESKIRSRKKPTDHFRLHRFALIQSGLWSNNRRGLDRVY